MVLESLVNPVSAEKRPWQMILLGAIFASISILLSLLVFKQSSSLVMVFFTVICSFPIVYNTIKLEELKDEEGITEKTLIKEHCKALGVFMFLFLGILLASVIWYVFLPPGVVEDLFSLQATTIKNINSRFLGGFADSSTFSIIFFNNLRVLSICILFSFLYGVGAMFILTWNATVIATAIGAFIREEITLIASNLGSVPVSNYFHIVSKGFLKYMPHGAIEILAYFVAALAGGIISTAVIRHSFGTRKFEKIIFDVSELLIISVALLVLSCLVEIFITPLLI